MSIYRLKIGASLVAALLISNLLMGVVAYGEKPVFSKEKAEEQMELVKQSVQARIANISNAISSLPFSNIQSQKVTPTPLPIAQIPPSQPSVPSSGSSSSIGFENLPTSTPMPTQPIAPTAPPTIPTNPRPIATTKPTTPPPPPTKKPEPPTATPIPDLPPITSETRPGNSIDDIFADVQKRLCVPAALMKAIQREETGSRFTTNAAAKFSTLNTYGWWNNANITINDLFLAAAYSAQSGKAPSDGKFAGQQIAKAIQPDAYDQMIMGLLQISQQEQDASFKNTSKIITTGKIDRRVLYDNALIFASVTKNKVGNLAETGCGDWSFKAVARAACKHLGGCNYNYGANNGNYCTKICTHYNEFAGTNYDCANASSLMEANGDDGKCTLK